MDHAARELVGVARSVLSELDLEVVLERVLEAARELTGAKYAALGVLDESRSALERFITAGVDAATRREIGSLPTGRGVLGELIAHPVPLRLADVGSHPRSYGFPSGHPPMTSFLGVPVTVAGEPFGNLYLADKQGAAEFGDEDEEALTLVAEFAGVAIDHARRFTGSEQRREALQNTIAALDASMQIARAIGGWTDLDGILELVAKRGRALVSARALVIEYRRGDELVIAAGAGELPPDLLGQRVDLEDSVASAALRTGRTQRLEDEPNRARYERYGLGRLGFHAGAGLVVPMLLRGQGFGVLVAIDPLEGGPRFSADDQRLLEAFATSAATAVATAETFAAERRSQHLAATEAERRRWARELHDETLQGLAALRLGLSAALRAGDPDGAADAMREAIAQLDSEIANLRSLITDLRPAALDEAGVGAAIEALAERVRRFGMEVDVRVVLVHESGRESSRLPAELETGLYRVVQEALTNARKHGGASKAAVEVIERDAEVAVSVSDDGHGFDPGARTDGFGLLGMRERTELLGGTLVIDSAPGEGSTVTAAFPVRRRDGAPAMRDASRAAS